MPSVPKYQGELDGLCGPYAIANALGACGCAEFDTIFRIACNAVAKNRWPKLLWDGTTFGDLERMIRACLDEVGGGVSVRYPFKKRVPKSNKDYWISFEAIFNPDSQAVCGVIGLTRPSSHWIVVSRDGNRLLFIDSGARAFQKEKQRFFICRRETR